ncbi:MAG: hypothetical protein N3A02_06540 [Rectinema sp.]|nr:hypothetical protein [Rectinema sp.]
MPLMTMAQHVMLAAQMRNLLAHRPDLVWYVPRRPFWGAALLSGSRCAVCLDGMAHLVMALERQKVWQPGMEFHAGLLARALSSELSLVDMGHGLLYTVEIERRAYAPCVVVDMECLPWFTTAASVTPAPQQRFVLRDTRVPLPDLPPVLNSPLLWASTAASAEEFRALVGEPPWSDLLPEPARTQRLQRWYQRAAMAEIRRLELFSKPVPAWLREMAHA